MQHAVIDDVPMCSFNFHAAVIITIGQRCAKVHDDTCMNTTTEQLEILIIMQCASASL